MAGTADIQGARVKGSAAEAGPRAREAEGVPAPLIVGAIALLVVLVSLPRFRMHVLRANRSDARTTLDLLGAYVFADEWQQELSEQAAPKDLFALIQFEDRLRHRFPDARAAGQGDVQQLLHHGYLFDTGTVVDGSLRRPALVAWPAEFGSSGDAAFARTRSGEVWAHLNGGLWSGREGALFDADLSDEGWRRVR